MKVTLKVVTGFVVAAAVVVGIAVLFVQAMPETQEVSEFEEKFKLVQVGDPEAKVLSVLGAPDAKEKEFRLGQMKGFEVAYARAAASNSSYYLFWFKGIDVVFTVGINDKGQVSLKESGGT